MNQLTLTSQRGLRPQSRNIKKYDYEGFSDYSYESQNEEISSQSSSSSSSQSTTSDTNSQVDGNGYEEDLLTNINELELDWEEVTTFKKSETLPNFKTVNALKNDLSDLKGVDEYFGLLLTDRFLQQVCTGQIIMLKPREIRRKDSPVKKKGKIITQ